MGRVGACSLSGCRMAAMRRLLGLPVACYSQGCPSHAPDYDRATKMCYYHYGEGCDIGGPGSCCSNSDCRGRGERVCEQRQGGVVCEEGKNHCEYRQGGVVCEKGALENFCYQKSTPLCSERGYCRKRSYQPTGPGCTKERGRVKCDIYPDAASACPQNRECSYHEVADAVTRKRTFSGVSPHSRSCNTMFSSRVALLGGSGGVLVMVVVGGSVVGKTTTIATTRLASTTMTRLRNIVG